MIAAAVVYITSHKNYEFIYRNNTCIINVNVAYTNQKVHEIRQP